MILDISLSYVSWPHGLVFNDTQQLLDPQNTRGRVKVVVGSLKYLEKLVGVVVVED